jgi:hypothetical protein
MEGNIMTTEETTATVDTSVPEATPEAPATDSNVTPEAAAPREAQPGETLTTSVTKEEPTTLSKSAPDIETAPKDEYAYDDRLYNEDGTFNKEGAKEYAEEIKTANEKYEKRILDLRRTVSSGEAPKEAGEYFQDYAPPEQFFKFFEPEGDDQIEGMDEIKGALGEVYHAVGLNKAQGKAVSDAFCGIMEGLKIFDTRSDAEKFQQSQEWITEQKKALGPEADNIIREARVFIDNVPALSAEDKNTMNDLMDKHGAGFVSFVHKLKGMYGGANQSIPAADLTVLGSLPSDAALKQEYLEPGTSEFRRNEIIQLRSKAGRKGRLMDAQF